MIDAELGTRNVYGYLWTRFKNVLEELREHAGDTEIWMDGSADQRTGGRTFRQKHGRTGKRKIVCKIDTKIVRILLK